MSLVSISPLQFEVGQWKIFPCDCATNLLSFIRSNLCLYSIPINSKSC